MHELDEENGHISSGTLSASACKTPLTCSTMNKISLLCLNASCMTAALDHLWQSGYRVFSRVQHIMNRAVSVTWRGSQSLKPLPLKEALPNTDNSPHACTLPPPILTHSQTAKTMATILEPWKKNGLLMAKEGSLPEKNWLIE